VGVEKLGTVKELSIITSRHVRHRHRIFQNFRPVAAVAKLVNERKKLGVGGNSNIAEKRRPGSER
jgi:hypothetical protein